MEVYYIDENNDFEAVCIIFVLYEENEINKKLQQNKIKTH